MKETDNDIVLLLIKENEKLEKEIATLKDGIAELKKYIDACQAQIDTLKEKSGWSSVDIEETIRNMRDYNFPNYFNYPSYK